MLFGIDSLNIKSHFYINDNKYNYFNIIKAAEKLGFNIKKMPFSIKILFENLLRFENDHTNTIDDIKKCSILVKNNQQIEIFFSPARILMQDFTGVPAVVDLAAMRDAVHKLGGDPAQINPLIPVDLVIDHSVQVDKYASKNALEENVAFEMHRNHERYKFLRWGQNSFDNFRVVPPGTGICHQVNLEYLSQVVWTKKIDNETYAFPDTLVGTDSHTTMVNGLGVLGWGVGGIEAEAAMLGKPLSMLLPEVIGVKLTGQLQEGVTATDLVLTITEILRKKGVVGKFVEYYGAGIKTLSLADRATIANMAPEYGATCGFFPVDEETIKYLKLTSRDPERIELVEKYSKLQGLWYDADSEEPEFSDIVEINISTIVPNMAGPKRPQDRIELKNVKESFDKFYNDFLYSNNIVSSSIEKFNHVNSGDVVIAAITSCTNTSNPSVMIAAGLVAKKAHNLGLKAKSWVKTSLAPGSQVVSEYLSKSGLQEYLDYVGFNIVGYGCTTCIGNSGPLLPEIEETIIDNNLLVASVLSGNRNFEGRVHPLSKANFLASPPLVVIYALTGTIQLDITTEAIAIDNNGEEVFLKDLWPSHAEINKVISEVINADIFAEKYKNVFEGDKSWQEITCDALELYKWEEDSTYIQNPPYFDDLSLEENNITPIKQARILAKFGDSITTDHISPAGNIAINSPAAKYLEAQNISRKDYNSYGARRGNHQVMMRGTFANIRIKNQILDNIEGGYTKYFPTNEQLSIYDAAMKYKDHNIPLVIFAGKEYGTGSSRDWAAKGTFLLGVKAVIAESFERIHRSNLVRMGVVPLTFSANQNCNILNINGNETIDIIGLTNEMKPGCKIKCIITKSDGSKQEIDLISRIDTVDELKFFRNQGVLQTVIKELFE
jgi:aconitate hydratase